MYNTIEVIKNIQLDLNLLLESQNASEILKTKSFSEPNESQLKKINELIGWESEVSDWMLVNFRASDNLINRSLRKWSLNVLELMRVKCTENPLLIDHEWDNSDASCGFIIDSQLVRNYEAPKNQKLGYEEINQKIIDKEGYVSLILTAAIKSDLPIAESLKHRSLDSCSTGGEIDSVRIICPHCSEEHGREVTFTETDKLGNFICPHLIPNAWAMYYDSEEDSEYPIADYIELDGNYENLELSICNIGNLPNAKVIR
jgi:hypothetical protein